MRRFIKMGNHLLSGWKTWTCHRPAPRSRTESQLRDSHGLPPRLSKNTLEHRGESNYRNQGPRHRIRHPAPKTKNNIIKKQKHTFRLKKTLRLAATSEKVKLQSLQNWHLAEFAWSFSSPKKWPLGLRCLRCFPGACQTGPGDGKWIRTQPAMTNFSETSLFLSESTWSRSN